MGRGKEPYPSPIGLTVPGSTRLRACELARLAKIKPDDAGPATHHATGPATGDRVVPCRCRMPDRCCPLMEDSACRSAVLGAGECERAGTKVTQSGGRPETVFAFRRQRKERLTGARHVRNAVARFDQVIDVSDADRALAFANIEKAASERRKKATEKLSVDSLAGQG